MDRVDLSERVIAIQRELVARADVALKWRRPGERAAECPARIRKRQRVKVDWCSISPQKRGLLDQFAVIPGGARFDGESGRDAGRGGGLHAAHPIATTVEDCAVADDTVDAYIDLYVVPVLLIDRPIPLDAPVHPHRLPAELVVGEIVGREAQGRYPAPVLAGLQL